MVGISQSHQRIGDDMTPADATPALATVASPKHTAVVVVDVQRVFASFPLYPPADEVLPRLAAFLETARSHQVPIIRVQIVIPLDAYSANWRQQFPELAPTWLAPGSDNVAFEPGFEPQPGDIVVTKHRFSAFHGTTLDTILRSRGIETVILTGLTSDVCVGTTARDAFQLEYAVITLSDCTAETSQACYEASLQTLADNFGIVTTAGALVEAWRAVPLTATTLPSI
jgi:nicotinamidase-related amidase